VVTAKVQGHRAGVDVDLTFLGGNYGGGSTARDALSKHATVRMLLCVGDPMGHRADAGPGSNVKLIPSTGGPVGHSYR